jgi:cell division protein FtsW
MFKIKKTNSPDYILLGITFSLLALGILILASVSAPFSQQRFGNTYHFLNHQLIYGLLPGLILGFLAFKINLSLIKKWAPWLLLGNLLFLGMVFIPGIGLKVESATRWVSLGPISFQPSEFLKITFILYLAAWFASREKKEKSSGQTFLIFIIIFGLISATLILQPDVSTLAIIFSIAALIYFTSNTPILHTVLIFFSGTIGLLLLIKTAFYRLNRFLVFLNPDIEPMGIGYQLKQSLFAIGSGGIFGVGLGMSMQKLGFLPQPISDSIFAVFSEETGFIGSSFLIFLFLLFLWRGFKISKEAKSKFYQITAFGITSWIVIQAFVNIGAMIGVLPLTGVPLPLVSYGGSALTSNLIGIGILLNISRNLNKA